MENKEKQLQSVEKDISYKKEIIEPIPEISLIELVIDIDKIKYFNMDFIEYVAIVVIMIGIGITCLSVVKYSDKIDTDTLVRASAIKYLIVGGK